MKLLLCALLAVFAVACTSEFVTVPGDSEAEHLTESPPAAPCDDVYVAADLDALQPCGNGAGHCYADARVPSVGTLLAHECSGGDVCVPDAVLEAKGGMLAACTTVLGGAGSCVSTLVEEVRTYGAELGAHGCAPDEACVPCVDTAIPTCNPVGVYAETCH